MHCVSIELYKHDCKFGRTRNAVGTRAAGEFPQLFRVLPNFHECSYNSIETRSTCFLFLLGNTATRKGKQLVNFDYKNANSLVPSLRQQLALVLCLHRVIQTRLLTNQRTSLGLFSKRQYSYLTAQCV